MPRSTRLPAYVLVTPLSVTIGMITQPLARGVEVTG
jgi:hypothetical protein